MRVLLGLVLLVVGAVTGLATVAVHGHTWGLVLAVVAVPAALLAVGPGWATRPPFALGFVAVVVRLAVPRPEGDFMVAADLPGYALLALTLAVVVVAVATLPRPARPHGPAETGP